MTKLLGRLRGLLKKSRFQDRKTLGSVFVIVFIAIGVSTLLMTDAATPTADVNICDDMEIAGNAFIGHDHQNASCGHYVSFGYNPPTDVSTALTKVAGGVTAAVDIVNNGVNGDNRLFIVSQQGRIYISNKDGSNATSVFLDLTSRIKYGGEQGLLGLAFDPNYEQNGYFYVNYIANAARGTFNGQAIGSGDTVISRFTRSGSGSADINSELIIMGYDQPAANHNGGALQFGPDGYLYISSGDGGSGGDPWTSNCPFGNGQCLNSYLGKILRIDINGANTTQRYKIPPGNPFASTANAKPEIWHTGLRNPWRFTFDKQTGDMFIGDVGQGAWEEVDFAPAGVGGKNFGWRCYEGAHTYNFSGNSACNTASNFTQPIYEYDHDTGCSITGGYIYRGSLYPAFDGTYVFSDYCAGKLWYLKKQGNGTWALSETVDTGFSSNQVSAFGQDQDGELYVALLSGNIYRIEVTH